MSRPSRPAARNRLPAFLLLVSCFSALAAEPGPPLEFLYIEANVGGSSGGHTALKIGDWVYHFQNDEGDIRLMREDWNRFRFVYSDLDNRNIHIAQIRVDQSDAERVRDRLSLLFMVQNRHVDFLEALDRDVALLRGLARGEPYEMQGIGFFDRRPHESPALHGLQAEIARRLGPGFLATAERRFADRLAALAYPSGVPADPAPEMDRYPQYPPVFSERVEDLYSHGFALTVIREEWPLRDGLLADAADVKGKALSEHQRRWLAVYRERLVDAVAEGLRATHSGSGFALLLALARFEAVSASLSANRLLVMDSLPAAHRAERFTPMAEHRELLNLLLNRLQATLPRIRREIFTREEPDEASYHQLERRASEIREIRRGLAANQPIRFTRRNTPPEGWGTVLLPLPTPRAEALEAATERAKAVRDRIEALYRYDLIERNCVTELVRAVDSAFPTQKAAATALGGYLSPGEDLSFVPHRFFDLVRQRYRIESVRFLPSYRNRMLRRLAERGEDWTVYAAEASTWTSSFYEAQPGDSLFLLFTEEVFWPRPLYGIVNLAYGLGGSAVGLLAAPFDRGRWLREGLRGALFSLPELVFGNIRKGSFNGIRSRAERDMETVD